MLNLPKNLEELGDEAFAGCGSLYGPLLLPGSFTTMGKGVFSGTHMGEEEEVVNGDASGD